MILASSNKNKKLLKKYTGLWGEIKNRIEAINAGKPIKYKKGFMRVKFESNDDLPLDKILNVPSIIIVVESVLKKYNKYYPQVFLHECLLEFVNEL